MSYAGFMTQLDRIFASLLLATSVAAGRVRGQATPPMPHTVRGTTMTASGAPIGGANVFLREALDAALSDSDGKFSRRTTATGRVTVGARRIGFAPASVEVPVDTSGVVHLTLQPQAAILVPIT